MTNFVEIEQEQVPYEYCSNVNKACNGTAKAHRWFPEEDSE